MLGNLHWLGHAGFRLDALKMISSEDTVVVTDNSVCKQLQGVKLICKEIKALSPVLRHYHRL